VAAKQEFNLLKKQEQQKEQQAAQARGQGTGSLPMSGLGRAVARPPRPAAISVRVMVIVSGSGASGLTETRAGQAAVGPGLGTVSALRRPTAAAVGSTVTHRGRDRR
jgi:hypothetical protein